MRTAAAIAMALVLAGCAGQLNGAHGNWYSKYGLSAPKQGRVIICHGFGCHLRGVVNFSRSDRAELASILERGKESPVAERQALSKAVQWYETVVGRRVGSSGDVGGLDMANAGVAGQMDCIDESTNTTSLLLLAEQDGLLRYHRTAHPIARGFLLDGRYPHASATIVENETGQAFVVDSWIRANAERPDIMTVEKWFATRPSI
ncbi:hypothetical protein [Coralliovum pocilloporae]|uniref:hypothetical protein n=1 Tax=Coralliovum pocilloporae TaxID=3066369 RepID=UPI00330706A0